MLLFYLDLDSRVISTAEQLERDVPVLCCCVADFNHTDIILLFDDEVQELLDKAIKTARLPVWATLIELDEYFNGQ